MSDDDKLASANIDRRALLERAAALLGGAAALSACGQQGASQGDANVLSAPGQEPGAVSGGYFTPARYAVLERMADLLIPETDTPGALAVGAPRTVDAMTASWASMETRSSFDGVLDALDKKARDEKGAGFGDLDVDAQRDLLAAFDAAEIDASPKMPPMPWPVALGAYPRLKELLLTAYYLSEAGATVELRHEIVPGPFKGDIPVQSVGRSWAY